MAGAELGSKVKLQFSLKDKNGEVFDETPENEPAELVLGEGDILPGIEVSLVGMESGESKSVELKPNMHFGERDNELIFELEKSEFPDDLDLKKGETLEYGFEDGNSAFFIIHEVDDEKVKLDGNHPLAGQNITAEIKVIEVT